MTVVLGWCPIPGCGQSATVYLYATPGERVTVLTGARAAQLAAAAPADRGSPVRCARCAAHAVLTLAGCAR